MVLVLATLGFVSIYAAFQSVAGVGLLLFGTPSLLLLGYGFAETLAIVVPASLVVSLLQLIGEPSVSARRARAVFLGTAPTLVTGLSFVLLLNFEAQIYFLVAAGLAAATALQVFLLFRKRPIMLPRRFEWGYLSAIGLLHGLTNLGGGFLATYASITGQNRLETRGIIALGYSIFGLIQVALLVLISPASFSLLTVAAMLIAGGVYLTLGRRLFAWTTESSFKVLMPVVTSLFCVSVIISGIADG